MADFFLNFTDVNIVVCFLAILAHLSLPGWVGVDGGGGGGGRDWGGGEGEDKLALL